MRQEFSNPTKSARTLSAPGHLLDDLSGGHGCHIGTSMYQSLFNQSFAFQSFQLRLTPC